MIKLFLVDDHSLLRIALREYLSRRDNLQIVGEAADGQTALREIVRTRPDVVLMDITLPDCDGIEATEAVLQVLPQARVIAVTMHPEEQYLLRFLEAGGRGYVNKAAADRELFDAIEKVYAGEIFVSRDGVQVLAGRVLGRDAPQDASPKADRPSEALSPRERQVLCMLSHGYTCRQVGERMYLSASTIETYKRRIMEKMKFADKTEMVEYAIRNNIFEEL